MRPKRRKIPLRLRNVLLISWDYTGAAHSLWPTFRQRVLTSARMQATTNPVTNSERRIQAAWEASSRYMVFATPPFDQEGEQS